MTLSSWVDCAFHAVAVDERRRPFVPTLWLQQPSAREHGQRIEQRWFTGCTRMWAAATRGPSVGSQRSALGMIERVTTRAGSSSMPPCSEQCAAKRERSPRLAFAVVSLVAPARRTIDGGLGHFGTRDDGADHG